MKKNNIEILMGEYKKIEKEAHVVLDDVMNKVTQEVCELVEADMQGDVVETYKEASDVIANIFSVSYELGIDAVEKRDNGKKSYAELIVLLGKWNSKIQGLRKRYSREKVDVSDAENITKEFVGQILNYTDSKMSLEDLIVQNTKKFHSRKELYKPKIDLKDYIQNFENFPKPGISFKDVSPILDSSEVLRYVILEMLEKCADSDVIVGLDARGFIFGSLIASHLGKSFVMLRKKGKLPGITKQVSYGLEYGKDVLEIQSGAIQKGSKVSIVDDLLATGGTMKAAIDLVQGEGGCINNLVFLISLNNIGLVNLDSRKILNNYDVQSLVSYD